MLIAGHEPQAWAWPLLGALVSGGIIGLEREWRGRPAGLRTHILVSLASALLMLAAMRQGDWAFAALPDENIITDPTRMAHGILTGIGFLCAGVIFRTGFSIHGLTTAASLWITAAIGVLFGAGLYGLGTAGTVITALVLIGLRLINAKMPGRLVVDVEVQWAREAAEAAIEVDDAVHACDPGGRQHRLEVIDGGRINRRTWRVTATDPQIISGLAERLNAIPQVTGYRLDPRVD